MKRNIDIILTAREKRYKKRIELHNIHNLPILVVTFNIPGPEKMSRLIKRSFAKFIEELKIILREKKISFKNEIIRYSPAGPEAFFMIKDKYSCNMIKKFMVEIEEKHFLGRLLDLDVYRSNGDVISRDFLNKKQRKCLICEQDARECIIKRKHSLEELKERIINKLEIYLYRI